jgi:methionine-rich copper-binding protein CopC
MEPMSSNRAHAARRGLMAWACVACAIALIAAPSAMGHSGLRATSPPAGAVVAALPANVTLTFRERLARVVRVQVLDARGRDHARSARLDPRNAAKVVVRTMRPVPGRYTVRWRVVAEDGHSESGSFAFRARGR